LLLGLLLPLQLAQAVAAPASQTPTGGPARLVAPDQPPTGPADSPSGARNGHPGHVVFHRTRNQPHAASSSSGTNNLTYHSGPTEQTHSTSYAIFWQPSGSYMAPGYQTLLPRYFGDVGGSPLYNVNTQYYDTGGAIVNTSAYAASWVDTSPYPSSTLTDADLQNEVLNAVNTNNWPWSSADVEFFVFTAKGENSCYGASCSFTQFCAYHSNFAATNGVTTASVLYANMPYAGTSPAACGAPSSPNNNPDADSEINLLSHEHMETVTDPLGTAWYDSAGSEIGDKCAWTFGATGSNGADVVWNGDPYIVQQEWSNATSSCVVAYGAQPVVSGLSPTSGTTAGGTSVTISGSGLSGATAVHFGSAAASFTINSATQVTAIVPAAAAGTVDVTVTGSTGTSATSTADQYTYVSPLQPTVTGVSPAAGPAAGGTTVTITGTNFASGAAVAFGSVAATAVTLQSTSQLTATAPAGSGTVDVTVTTSNGASAPSSADQFTYDPVPVVSAVGPASGPLSGGTAVTVTGSGFVAGATVQFGAGAATNVTLVSATQLTATAPAGNAGSVDVTVTTPGGTSASSAADQFTYLAAPTVSAISPASGGSGTVVTITGTNFVSGATVTFGSAAATGVTVTSASQLTATAPSGSGTVSVLVTTPGGSSTSSTTSQFTYTVPTFTLTATPSTQTVSAGARTSYTLTLTAVNGYTAAVRLTVSGLPSRTSASFSANPVTPTASGATSTLTLSTARKTSRGTFTLTVTGTGTDGQSESVYVQLTVQ